MSDEEWTVEIARIDIATCEQVLNVLQCHGVTRGMAWEGGSPLDERMRILVNATFDPTVETTIRRDIAAIAGATIEE